MNLKLLGNACAKFFLGLVLVGALLFLPARTFDFPNAWLFIALLFIPMFIFGIVLLFKSPELLAKRLRSKESEAEQRRVIAWSALLLISMFVLSALDFRFSWSRAPAWVVVLGCVLFVAAYALYAEVVRENAFLSRTVEVQENQKVVDRGLYSVVRHPMYSATILLYLSIPLVLGSFIAIIPMALIPAVLVKRIQNEEQVLTKGLDGYAEYKKRVKYRLIPFVW